MDGSTKETPDSPPQVKMPGVDIIITTAILLIKSRRLLLKATKFETAITTKRNNKLLFIK